MFNLHAKVTKTKDEHFLKDKTSVSQETFMNKRKHSFDVMRQNSLVVCVIEYLTNVSVTLAIYFQSKGNMISGWLLISTVLQPMRVLSVITIGQQLQLAKQMSSSSFIGSMRLVCFHDKHVLFFLTATGSVVPMSPASLRGLTFTWWGC